MQHLDRRSAPIFFWIGLKRRSTEPVSHVTKMDECLLLSDEM